MLRVLIFSLCIYNCAAWDNDELEMFDLVEEVNENFYKVMGLEQSASTSEIRKTYRKLSLVLHPDKNNAEDAEVKFRQLVAIYEILKDKERRQQYDLVLEQGLPDWRQPVYYYRRVRKLGLAEILLLLVLIFTVGHFLVIWAAYIEKRFEAEVLFGDRRKKKVSRKKARQAELEEEEEIQELLNTIPRPSLIGDLLPVKLARGSYWLVMSVPVWWREYQEEKKRIQEEEEAERLMQEELEEEIKAEREERAERKKKPRKRVQDLIPEKRDGEDDDAVCPVVYMPVGDEAVAAVHEKDKKLAFKTGEWTDEDHQLLAKACTRFPGGSTNRWEKMSAFVNRPVKEVIKKVAERKGGYVKTVDTASQGITGAVNESLNIKVKMTPKDGVISTRDDGEEKPQATATKPKKTKPPPKAAEKTVLAKETANSTKSEEGNKDEWTQNQQKIFEWGLSNFPKGTEERWEKVAEHIPGKNKDDCIARFKYLADVVRKRKQEQQQKLQQQQQQQQQTT